MFYGTYRFSSVFENDAHLPHYKGSTFRGVFGRGLKKVVSVMDLIKNRKSATIFK